MPVAALDIGGSSVKAGRIVAEAPDGQLHVTPLVHHAPADEIVTRLAAAIRLCGADASRVVVAVPDPFDHAAGVSLMTHKFARLYGQPIGPLLEAELGRPLDVRWCNDAAAAVTGEARVGAGREFTRVLGITIGTGLGAAFVVDGEPVPEAGGVVAGDLWRVVTHTGATADRAFAARTLLAAVAADPATGGSEFGRDLAGLLAPAVVATEAEVVVVGGGGAGSFAEFAGALQAGLAVPVRRASLGAWAPLIGAAHLSFPG